MNKLIVIDMQNDFITGSLANKDAQVIIPAVVEKIKVARKDGYKIEFTFDTHSQNYLDTFEGKHLSIAHCIKNTDGWKLAPEIDQVRLPEDAVIEKNSFAANWPDDDGTVDKIEIVGICTDICVVSNALALRTKYPNAEIYVYAALCAGTSEEAHKAALMVMNSCQINII